jgi:hypothetical protein
MGNPKEKRPFGRHRLGWAMILCGSLENTYDGMDWIHPCKIVVLDFVHLLNYKTITF